MAEATVTGKGLFGKPAMATSIDYMNRAIAVAAAKTAGMTLSK